MVEVEGGAVGLAFFFWSQRKAGQRSDGFTLGMRKRTVREGSCVQNSGLTAEDAEDAEIRTADMAWRVIGAAIGVHRELLPGLVESP